MRLSLFLASDDQPAVPEGVAEAHLALAATPSQTRGATHHDGDPTDPLAVQRWAVVYPQARPELLDALGPLIARRQEDQGAAVLRFPAHPDDDGTRLFQHLYDGGLSREESPRYVLVLGDLHEVSLDLQQRLAEVGALGRLAFDTVDGDRAYAEKALRWEDADPPSPARTLLYGAYDASDSASVSGERDLLAPIAELAARQAMGPLPPQSFGRVPQGAADGMGALLTAAGAPDARLLLTVTHGLASASWSPQVRRARQGELRIARGVSLAAEHVAGRAFLPGGLWVMFACFSAGTPSWSRFEPWLRELVDTGVYGQMADVVSALATDRPFIATLPRAALANPEGPLGVYGHIDLAWGWSFRDEAGGGASRARRFGDLLQSAARGDRVGLAYDPIQRAMRGAGHTLFSYAQVERRRALTTDERRERGHHWMTWNDLGAWILLGDPAARVPGPRLPPRTGPGPLRGPALAMRGAGS